jgi:WD40-like Beta Propeller Repeat
MDRGRKRLLVGLAALCVLIACGYVASAAFGPSPTTTGAKPEAAAASFGGGVMVRAVDPADPRLNGRVFVVRDGRTVRRSGADLTCERVYYANGRGICLGVAASGVEYTVTLFDSGLRPLKTMALTGLPSRARVSADGRYGAMTVFVAGDAYQGVSSAFSTRTYLLDMASGKTLGQLERFSVRRDGRPFDAADFNFWGVTFDPGDSDRFYATLATGEHHYLVEGSVRRRATKVLRDGVECPSLSPDGRRIAFKSRIGHADRWRLEVLDLATLDAHPLAERRSIDDQAEWLDNRTVVYSDGRDVYAVPAGGGGSPRLLIRDASSPVRLESPPRSQARDKN